jgi:xanthine dehydrogenase YagS FAD-binding subunit
MLPSFRYVRPATLDEALAELAAPDAAGHAGGTDLLGALRDRAVTASTVVSLSAVGELRGIEERPSGELRLGALATLAEIAAHPLVRARAAALAEAAGAAATPQIRNQGTLGGNLCQRPRCWYFRSRFDCARRGGAACSAVDGENLYHAIFGGDGCYMVHPSDTAPALVALQASVRVAGPAGPRTLPIGSFFVLPSQDLEHENVLRAGEIVTEVVLPPAPPGHRSAYRKMRVRGAWDFALAGAAVAAVISDGRVRQARVVLSGVAPAPWRSPAAEEALVGRRLDVAAASGAGAAAVRGARPLSGNAYKVSLARAAVEDAVLALA